MPIHLGIALFSATTAITAIHRTKVTLKNKKVYDADESRPQYVRMKWMTWAMDYSFFGLMFFFFDKMNKSDDNFTPTNVFIQICKFVISIFAHDLIKAFWFRDLVAKAKLGHLVLIWKDFVHACITIDGMKKNFSFLLRILKGEGWLTEFTDDKEAQLHSVRHNIWYFIKIGIFLIPAAGALQVNYGMMYWLPITQNVCIYGKDEWYETHVSCLVVVYMDFLVVMFIKDGISMNIFHQIMHNKWYNHHKAHHLTMKELSIPNAFYFDILDVIVENAIGPTFLCLLKFLFGAEPSFHYYTFLLATGCDINIHSISPYSVAFWNPLFDNMMRCALSHNLHHSTNIGHYTIWPLHQIPGMGGPKHKGKNSDGFDYDIREYNKILETRFPEDL
jgi:hypothetical protein